jgi:4-amino-4-deoxy-L-arabinose transferase-like glycosyltransferase
MFQRESARTWFFLVVISAFFVCAGVVFIRYPGLQNDELFFAPPIYVPRTAFYSAHLFGAHIPLMVMSYTGALKTWIYAAVFSIWAPSRWSVRIPVLIACLATIWLTWIWARMAAGRRTAIAAAALLATDAIFLLTGVLDWGPVALQHLLMMAGLVSVTYYLRSKTRWALALGFFFWGLGLWDKALMIWPLTGFALAAVCVYPRELRRELKPAAVAVAITALLAGAAPLVWFNVARHGETATANAVFSTDDYAFKLKVLQGTIDGSILCGYLVERHSTTQTRPPRGLVERFSLGVRRVAGDRMYNWFSPVLVAAILSLAWLRRSRVFRPMLFLLIAAVVAWIQMFITHDAGGGAHHTILLWPLPFLFVGMAIAATTELAGRRGATLFVAVVSLLALGNLLNENEYLARFAIRGGIGGWTDAIYPLSATVDDSKWIGTVDWGYTNGLRVLHQGRIQLFNPADYGLDSRAGAKGAAELARMVENPDLLYVEHTESKQLIPRVNDRLRNRAAGLGYGERVERVIPDSSGDPVFEIFHFEKTAGSAQVR